jgi:hypothetical protein
MQQRIIKGGNAYFFRNLLKKKVANGISTRIPSNIAYTHHESHLSAQVEPFNRLEKQLDIFSSFTPNFNAHGFVSCRIVALIIKPDHAR